MNEPLMLAGTWLAGYFTTLLLGVQSRNATAGHYGRCAITSFAIAFCQAVAINAVHIYGVLGTALLTGTAGAAGICTAIAVNTHVFKLSRVR